MRGSRKLSFEEALQKGRAFCAYQERAPKELAKKFTDLGLHPKEVAAGVKQLEEESYLDEFRFARVFARSKFRQKGWGKLKISQALWEKGVSGAATDQGLDEIADEDYKRQLEHLIAKKNQDFTDETLFEKKQKLGRYLAAKGFESNLVWKALETLKDQTQD